MRILFLHGFGQNSTIFSKQTSVLRKFFAKNGIESVYLEAPHRLPEDEKFGWWRWNEESNTYDGWLKSLDKLGSHAKEHGPFDGILGFSQGAILTGLLSSPRLQLEYPDILAMMKSVQFVVLVSGFKARAGDLVRYYHPLDSCGQFNLPSIHIYGSADEIVPCDWSRDLALCFSDAQLIEHPGGHYLPQSSEIKSKLFEFISKYMEKR